MLATTLRLAASLLYPSLRNLVAVHGWSILHTTSLISNAGTLDDAEIEIELWTRLTVTARTGRKEIGIEASESVCLVL